MAEQYEGSGHGRGHVGLSAAGPNPRSTGGRGLALPPGQQETEFQRFISGRGWVEVQSSNVRAIAYFPDEKALLVAFLNGSAYKYPNVPESAAEHFFYAPSYGQWVWDNLRRSAWPFTRVA